MLANLENSAVAWKRSVFIPIPKKCNAKECSNYRTIALISHASKVMLKIQAGFRKGRGTRDQIANICWIMGKARELKQQQQQQQQNHLLLLYYAKTFDCGSQ